MTRLWIAAAGLIAVACGGSTPGPAPTPLVQPPQILCPADVKVGSVMGTSQMVTFSAPTVTGGSQPVNVTCARSSGDSFPLGTTAVSCSANDATARHAACSFTVTLTGFSLGVTKFDAFGDSLTEGENGAGPKPTFLDPPNSYPTKLQALFDTNFPGQGVTVLNRGEGGRKVDDTLATLRRFLPADRPDAVLLLTGYNNLTLPCGPGQADTFGCGVATQEVADGVRECVRKTKESSAGVKYIFLSTLTPPGTGPKRIERAAIVETNVKIRLIAAAERVTLVDPYPLFIGHEAEYVSIDGLHLNPPGYQAIADAFFTAIKATVPQTPLPSIR
jgi:lysophospholipase L1-like esterase